MSSAAYGLGTQVNDGSAAADSNGSRSGGPTVMFERGTPSDPSMLADTLGVDASELRTALLDFHERERAHRRDELAGALAEELGVPVGEVTAALEQIHDRLRPRFEAGGERPDVRPAERPRMRHAALPLRRLAAALDVTPAELRRAFREIKPGRPVVENAWKERERKLAEFLAERFDLDAERVSGALADSPRPCP